MARWDGYTLEGRFWEKVEKMDSGCWLWKGARLSRLGHGALWVSEVGRAVPAHRVAYELLVGPIPEGRHLHHLCGNPQCVNPEHVVPTTPGMHRFVHRLARCHRGHPFDEANTHIDKRGNRHCRACDAERHKMARARRRGLSQPIGQGRRAKTVH